MNLYGGPIDRYLGEEKSRKYSEPEAAFQGGKYRIRKPETGDSMLTREQIAELKDKYNPAYMSCEEEETLLQDLYKMGILSEEDCGSYTISGGNLFESLNRQVSSDINLLYRMAIAGKYCNRHIEHIKREQKLLNVLEQLSLE